MAEYLVDFPPGPLDRYRKIASLDWKKLKIFIDSKEMVKYEHSLHNELKSRKIYNSSTSLSLDEQRLATLRIAQELRKVENLQPGKALINLKRININTKILTGVDQSATVKNALSYGLGPSVLLSMGTKRHYHFVEKAYQSKINMCFCLTEIAHGSNTKEMQTTATYDPGTKEFILHTKDFQAAKCWAGNLGQTATHAVVFAQLISKDVHHGLHAFIVEIRDPSTFRPYPGIVVGDMGEKIGLNGVDNGFILFHNYHIPREALLNKMGDVLEDGTYVTSMKDPNKRHGASLGVLSGGRVNITLMGACYLSKAVTIALRYAAVRTQFGPGEEELPILEYQSHQYRLIPYLAAAYVLYIAGCQLTELYYQLAIDSAVAENKETLPSRGLELHAISCASKPISTWVARDGIQECRECCGGHGYLRIAGIGDIRNTNDPALTYEGDNHVIIQQAANWLLKYWPLILKREKFSTPYNSLTYLNDALHILKTGKFTATSIEDICKPENILGAYQWLICYLLKQTYEKLENNLKNGVDTFKAKNEVQVYFAKSLAVAYIQQFNLHVYCDIVSTCDDLPVRNVLQKLFSLYGLWSLEKHIPHLYQGGYAHGPELVTLMHNAVLSLCKDLKDDAVALVDAIALPDFLLNSVLGTSDGLVYKHLETEMLTAPGALSRPYWWKEILSSTLSKL